MHDRPESAIAVPARSAFDLPAGTAADGEPPARLAVAAPHSGALARGLVVIPYRTDPPGPHRVLLELADPLHRVIDRATVSLTIPPRSVSKDH